MFKRIKSIATTAILLVSSALLGACSSFGSSQASNTEDDLAKVAAIERAASQSGVRVYWLRYPQKRVSTTTNAAPQNSGS